MQNYNDDISQIRYSKHYGHRAWPYYSEGVDGAALEDLFWRMVQTNPNFAVSVARTVWPQAERMRDELLLTTNQRMSLWPESCGGYVGQAYGSLSPLRGDADDVSRRERAMKCADRGGYYLGPLVAMHTGWLSQNVVPNLLHAMGQKLTVSDRFRFNLRANYRRALMGKALSYDEVERIVKMAYPVIYGLSTWKVYWYKTENGNVSHGVIDFSDSFGLVHRLTLSAWEPDFPSSKKVIYDLLNIAKPYALYDLDKLVQHKDARYAIIVPSEATVDYIGTDHAWIPKCFPVTTYASIDDTAWYKLSGMTPVIFPEATAGGCREAFRLHAALEKGGLKALFMKRQNDEGCGSSQFIQDLGKLAIAHSACRLPEFAEHCQRVFGVQPPDGILPKAVPLADLPEPAAPLEVLMDGLLNTGEQMTIHAWRGIGKSLFAMLLALCFASGKRAINGRVCPSRKYRVLLLDGEMSSRALKRRARRLCNGHGLPIETTKELKIRSNRNEKKALELETDAGLKELKPDMEAVDIIIVDSVFKFFPSAMKPDFDATKMMQRFLDWARENEKTLIVIDHEGKGGATSYGSMGKEIGSDVVLRLCHAKSPHVIEAHVQKVRDHAEPSGPYLRMRIEGDKDEYITIQNCDASKVVAALEVESSGSAGEGEPTESSAEDAKSLDEAINQYVSEHPEAAQGVIVTALKERGYGGRSTIQARIKALSEAGKLPGWQNRPETHKVAKQETLEGDQN